MESSWVSVDSPGCSSHHVRVGFLRLRWSNRVSKLIRLTQCTAFGASAGASCGDSVVGSPPMLASHLHHRMNTQSLDFAGCAATASTSSYHVDARNKHTEDRLMLARICMRVSGVSLPTSSSRSRRGAQLARGKWSVHLVKKGGKLHSMLGKQPRMLTLCLGSSSSAAGKSKCDSGNPLWNAASKEELYGDKVLPKVLAELVPVDTSPGVFITPSLQRHSENARVFTRDVAEIASHLADLGLDELARDKCLDHVSDDATATGLLDFLATLQSLGLTPADIATLLTKFPAGVKVRSDQCKLLVAYLSNLQLALSDIGQIFLRCPSLLLSDERNMREITDFFASLGVQDIAAIILGRPQVLNHPADRIKNILGVLMEAAVPKEDLERVIRKAPELFSGTTLKNLKPKLEFLTEAGLRGGGLGKAIARRPNILNYNLEKMRNTSVYLQGMLGEKGVAKLIKRYAEVLVLDPRRKMLPVVNYLLHLGVKPDDLGKVILRRPQILGYTLNGMQPTVDYFLTLGVKEKMLGKVITISPQVLTLNVEDKLKPVVEFFRSNGLSGERDMEYVLTRNAQILCCSIEQNLRPKFEFLTSLGLETKEIASMIVLFPSMLGQSIGGSLQPKSYYLVHVMNRSVHEVVDFPQYFGYSLEKRIKPRYEKLVAKGVKASLASMLACVDADFEMRYVRGNPPKRRPYKSRRRGIPP